MKIFLDGTIFSLQRAGGISSYLGCLIREFFKLKYNGKKIDFTLGVCKNFDNNIEYKSLAPEIKSKLKYEKINLFDFSKGFFPISCKKLIKYDILHSPYFWITKSKIKKVLTVHDLTDTLTLDFKFRTILKKAYLNKAIHRTDSIICCSEVTKQNLVSRYEKVENKRIDVIYNGISDVYYVLSAEDHGNKFRQLYGKRYLIYVGNRRGYKNFNCLLNLFSKVFRKFNLYLVCVGGGDFDKAENDIIDRLKIRKAIFKFSYLSKEELHYLYSKASALVYPSLKEGFGIPLMEAMASGCPVICSDIPVFREVGADVPIYLSNYSVESFKEVFSLIFTKKKREKIKEEGRERAFLFTEKKVAINTLEVYKKLLNE